MELLNNLQIVNYDANAGFGVIFPAKTIIVNAKNAIYIISPCDLELPIIKELNSSEKQIYIIAPNNFHNLHLATMQMALPKAMFYGPKRSADQSGVELANTKDLPQNDLKTTFIQGNNTISETCFYHEESESLIVTDLMFNLKHKMNIPTRLAMTFAGTYKKLGTSRALKMTIKDKKKFKSSIESLLAYPFKNVILTHGKNLSRSEFETYIKTL
jgi:spore germination protein YaaH